MGTVPQTKVGRIEFFEDHLAVWAADPTSIGIAATDVVDLSVKVDAARAAYETAHASRNQAKADTEGQDDAIADMYDLGADLIKTIRAYAQKTNNPTVYQTAQIPAPKPPSPVGKPDAPTEVAAEINAFGYAVIKWKGNRTGGTYYILERQLTPVSGAPEAWAYAGSSTANDYTDTTIPVGFQTVTYRVFARRPAGDSTPTVANPIYFGIAPGDSEGETLSIAA